MGGVLSSCAISTAPLHILKMGYQYIQNCGVILHYSKDVLLIKIQHTKLLLGMIQSVEKVI